MKTKYVVVRPATPKGKWKVLASTISTANTFYEIAECPNETQASVVRLALEMQGEAALAAVPPTSVPAKKKAA